MENLDLHFRPELLRTAERNRGHHYHWTNPDAAMETIEEDLTKSLYNAMEKDEVFLKRI